MDTATSFAVADWAGWIPAPDPRQNSESSRLVCSDAPDVSAIPAMLRRRLSTQGRTSLAPAIELIKRYPNAALVYCSRHGDVERSLRVLEELVTGTPVSPMQFSLSVHNAIAGIVSINNQITECISSIAYGNEGLPPTLLEAIGLLSEQRSHVICLISDIPPPTLYREQGYGPVQPFSASFVVSRTEGTPLTLSYNGTTDPGTDEMGPPQAIDFLHFLESANPTLAINHNGGEWQLRKQ